MIPERNFVRPDYREDHDNRTILSFNQYTIAVDRIVADTIWEKKLMLSRGSHPPYNWFIYHPEHCPRIWENRFVRLADWIANDLGTPKSRNSKFCFVPANPIDPNDYRRQSIMTVNRLEQRLKRLPPDIKVSREEDGFVAELFRGGKTAVTATPEQAVLLSLDDEAEFHRRELARLLQIRKTIRIGVDHQQAEVDMWIDRNSKLN
jgi:hypothetical protein